MREVGQAFAGAGQYQVKLRPVSGFYQHYVRPSSSCKWKHKLSLLNGMFPTVCAQEALMFNPDDPTKQSTSRLLKRVPVTDEDAMAFIQNETGRERIKNTINGTYSAACGTRFTQDAVLGMAQMGCVVGFAVGWLIGVNKGIEEFTQKHRLTKFATQYRAVRMRTDTMMLSGLRHGGLWAFKISGFLALFTFTAECISVYRNSSNPLDHTAAGALTCGVLRSHLGLRGSIVGAAMGVVLGSVSGLGFWTLATISDTSREKRHLEQVKALLQMQADDRSSQGFTAIAS